MALRDQQQIEADDMESLCEELATGLDSGSLADPLQVCAGIQQEGFGRNFANQEAADGTPWPPHKPATVAMYGPHPLLILSGEMKRQATTNAPLVADRQAAVVIESDYASRQNFGQGNIPAREFLFASQTTLELCDDALADFIEANIL